MRLNEQSDAVSHHRILRPALVLGITLAVVLTGCAAQQQVAVEPETTSVFAPTTLVQVLQQFPSQPYWRIAKLDATGVAGTPSAQLLALLQERAARLGADAIVVEDLSTREGSTLQFNPSGGQFSTSSGAVVPHFRAYAIRFKSDK